ncbi:hypothetical protein PVK06_046619 [Gossypium arboreum]|uniref:Uncharacterized protein n=1 Tax=Gossypium arboreum TaxID=29729 RepID=A0ABR0MB10_GOSAR|nr:hypothetical protein PVK06_046619 [Gossypium arboreum]
MSEKQKGLVKAICIFLPNAETRHCVRHLHANFKKAGFQTNELKDLLWKAARASTTREFEDAMDELRKTNQHAYDWLKENNPTHWLRSHFSIRSHSDMLVNNLSESFNKVKRHKVGVPIQQQATPNQQEGTLTQQAALTQLPTAPTHQQAALRQKLPFKRKPTTVRWMPSTQESSMIDH